MFPVERVTFLKLMREAANYFFCPKFLCGKYEKIFQRPVIFIISLFFFLLTEMIKILKIFRVYCIVADFLQRYESMCFLAFPPSFVFFILCSRREIFETRIKNNLIVFIVKSFGRTQSNFRLKRKTHCFLCHMVLVDSN